MESKQGLKKRLVDSGMAAMLRGAHDEAAWCLDSALRLYSDTGPTLWQRGLSCFFTGRYEEGALQFARDMKEDGFDVEEVIWNFACRCKSRGLQGAMQEGFLDLAGPPSVAPMGEVLSLFKGSMTPDDVISAATNQDGSPVKSYNDTNALAYAHFYIGLYYEFHGDLSSATDHFRKAAAMENPDYLGRLMIMYFDLFCKTSLPLGTLVSFRIGDAATGYDCTSIIHGGWQLTRGHLIHGPTLHKSDLVSGLLRAYHAGIRAFTCGDIYTGVEELYGDFIRAFRARGGRVEDLAIHTTLVPDADVAASGKVDREFVRSSVMRSLNRFGLKKLDLVQFCWWDMAVEGWREAAASLCTLRGEGLVRQIGVTNFSTEDTQALLDAGVPIAVTQIQYSLLDQRPLHSGLVDLCAAHGVHILPYGVLAGGFISDAWLGKPSPDPENLANRSLVKYWLIIQEFGGWELFQQLLTTLREIADSHMPLATLPAHAGVEGVEGVSIAMVAMQYVLSQRQVAGIITGAHHDRHIQSTLAATSLRLTDRDLSQIAAVLGRAQGPRGPVFGLERVREGIHGRIMWRSLSWLHQGPHLEELCHRFLKLMFQAYPAQATRKGYRLPPPTSYSSLCRDICTGANETLFDCDQIPLLAQRACSYDHLLDVCSEHEIVEHCQRVSSLLKEAQGLEQCISSSPSLLTPDQLVDLKIVTSQLELELVKWNELQQHRRDPGFYLPLSPVLCLLPLWGPDASLAEPTEDSRQSLPNLSHPGVAEMSVAARLLALLSRVRAIPRVLENAAVNLTLPVTVFVQTALKVCVSFQPFLETTVPQLCRLLVSFDPSLATSGTGPQIMDQIELACEVASVAIENYANFLRNELLLRSSASTSIGKETYDKILQLEHFIGSSEELLSMGRAHFEEVQAELESLAREIDSSKTWQEITEQVIRPVHPTSANLLPDFMSEIHRAREFTIGLKLVSDLPEGEKVVGFYTSKFLTPFSPFGDFLNPCPYAGMDRRADEGLGANTQPHSHLVGHLHLHPVDVGSGMTEDEKEECLRALDYTFISVVAPHESYPGHHVQALLAQAHPRPLRKYYESILFYEGWGLYTEELAFETGFFEKEQPTGAQSSISATEYSKLTRLTQLRLRLWRAARILLDVQLNTGRLTFEQCREFLQKEVMFSARASQGEVFIYLSRPGYASCYLAGYLMLMQLREQAKQRSGFSLQSFHDSLLSNGCLPFKLLELLL